MRLAILTLSLACGEGVAAQLPICAGCWPVFAVLAVLTILFGYGLGLRQWPVPAALLLGFGLYLHAAVAQEETYRETPWLRHTRAKARPLPRTPVRRDLARRVAAGLDPRRETVALNRAILLGERHRIPLATRRVFAESGTMHVFAISGLHVMVVAKTLVVILAMLFVPRRWAGVLSLPLLWGYVWLIGLSASAVRAALMASLYFVAPAFWRRSDALRAWCLTFWLMHVAEPLAITDIGSLLSFAVVLALICAGRIASAFASPTVRTLFLTSVAWAAGTPIAAYAFGRVTPGGLLANLVLVTTASYSVAAGAVGVLASFVSSQIAAYVNNLAALFTDAMVAIAEVVSKLPAANFEGERWSFAFCVIWYAALVSLLLIFHAAYPSRSTPWCEQT